jgi:release factor glutamine methyltransferase
MILRDAIRAATQTLTAAGIDSPARDARLLVAHATGIPPDRLTLHETDPLLPDAATHLADAITRRAARQPLSQITGQRLFWGHLFRVTPATLDPRPETETLVAAALELPFLKMLDLGTGTGCILLSCLVDRRAAHGTGTDLSPDALAVAQDNAARLGLTTRTTFHLSDWFTAITGRFDLIVSNPPYIAAAEMPHLAPEVRDHEPHLALTPGGDGLDAYRIIAQGAPARLLDGGRILLEIGPTQGPAVMAMLTTAGLTDVHIRPDMDGRDRVVAARKAPPAGDNP